MLRRPFVIIGALLPFLLVACGGQPSASAPAAAPEEAVNITFWHGQSGVLGERLKTLVSQFNSSHKIQVEASFQGNYTELYQKVIAAIQAGTPPTLAQVPGPNQAAAYLKAKAITPVQEFVDSPDGFTADQLRDFQPQFLDDSRLTVNGKKVLVSWPLSKSLPVLFYNPAILRQAGISDPPKTWDELRQDLLLIKQKTSAIPFEWSPAVYYFWIPQLRANGGDVLSPNFDKATFNTDAGVSALQYAVDLVNTDKVAVVTRTGSFDWQDDFAKGKVALVSSTNVSLPFIEQKMPAEAKFEVGMAPLPTARKAGNTLFGNNLVVFSKPPKNQQRAAWLFMKWLTETDQTVKWALDSGYMPVRASALNDPTYKNKVAADQRLRVPFDAAKDAQGVPATPDWPKIEQILNDAMVKAITQKATAKQALAEAESKVNDVLKGF